MAGLLVAGCAATGGEQDKVVYHVNEGLAQASNGLRNIGNHLEAKPNTRIVVVTHSLGIDFLLKGAKDKNGNRYIDQVERFKLQGVKFEVCEIAMRTRKLTKDDFIEYATFVPSGVAEVTRLQLREGYAYLKP
jgi:intracellular sulfur oxidation DsrE/DsrF family protein